MLLQGLTVDENIIEEDDDEIDPGTCGRSHASGA